MPAFSSAPERGARHARQFTTMMPCRAVAAFRCRAMLITITRQHVPSHAMRADSRRDSDGACRRCAAPRKRARVRARCALARRVAGRGADIPLRLRQRLPQRHACEHGGHRYQADTHEQQPAAIILLQCKRLRSFCSIYDVLSFSMRRQLVATDYSHAQRF